MTYILKNDEKGKDERGEVCSSQKGFQNGGKQILQNLIFGTKRATCVRLVTKNGFYD